MKSQIRMALAIGLFSAGSIMALTTNTVGTIDFATETWVEGVGTVASVTDGILSYTGSITNETSDLVYSEGSARAYIKFSSKVTGFTTLPTDMPTNIQAAIAFQDDGDNVNTPYAYVNDNGTRTWVALGGTPATFADNAAIDVEFWVVYAGTQAAPTAIYYAVLINGTAYPSTDTSLLYSALSTTTTTTVTPNTAGIYMPSPIIATTLPTTLEGSAALGSGTLDNFEYGWYTTTETSTAIDMQIYLTAGATGAVIEFAPVGEKPSSDQFFIVQAFINGQWVEIGRVPATMAASYQVSDVNGLLVAGQSYDIRIIDEEGNTHERLAATVETFKTTLARMTSQKLTIGWKAVVGRTYSVQYADTPMGPWSKQTWETVDGQTIITHDSIIATSTDMTLDLPISASKSAGFFRMQVEELVGGAEPMSE